MWWENGHGKVLFPLDFPTLAVGSFEVLVQFVAVRTLHRGNVPLDLLASAGEHRQLPGEDHFRERAGVVGEVRAGGAVVLRPAAAPVLYYFLPIAGVPGWTASPCLLSSGSSARDLPQASGNMKLLLD